MSESTKKDGRVHVLAFASETVIIVWMNAEGTVLDTTQVTFNRVLAEPTEKVLAELDAAPKETP